MNKVQSVGSHQSYGQKFKTLFSSTLAVICLAYGQAQASEAEAYWPPVAEAFTENNISISHIGSAMRYQGSEPVYIASLYSQDKVPNSAVLMSNDGSKELQLIVMKESMSHRRLQRMLKNDLIISHSNDAFSKLQQDIDTLLSALKADYRIGSLITISYDSLRDTTAVALNSERKAIINGKDIFNATLRAMVGSRPPSRQFKEALLGEIAPVIDMTEEQEVLLTQYMNHQLNPEAFNSLSNQELVVNVQTH
ncbi:chalcone isomerase family protein [Litoribrevibacter euphylliae]|uniref:Chalcone isomerase family protein n=1 Tax=Litoribrevibacter euphylliae TaxID=1834034 RepID=A0ABV7H9J2_9GAMM